MKQQRVPPAAIDLLRANLAELNSLAEQREEAISELMEEQAESKAKATADIKKKFTLKMAMAKKQGKDDSVLKEQQEAELARVTTLWKERGAAAKLRVKQEFNTKS